MEVKNKITMKMEFDIVGLTEDEIRALYAITSYGTKQFLKSFYENMGAHYLSPYENGLISLFDKIKEQVPDKLEKADKMHEALQMLQ